MDEEIQKDKQLWEFAQDLMREKGEAPNDARCSELKEQMEQEVQKAILVALPDDRFDAFEAESQKDEPDESVLDGIIEGANLDFETITTGALEKFRDAYLGGENE